MRVDRRGFFGAVLGGIATAVLVAIGKTAACGIASGDGYWRCQERAGHYGWHHATVQGVGTTSWTFQKDEWVRA